MASPMPDDWEVDVPPICKKWPGCEGKGEFDVDRWAKVDATCNWPNCCGVDGPTGRVLN